MLVQSSVFSFFTLIFYYLCFCIHHLFAFAISLRRLFSITLFSILFLMIFIALFIVFIWFPQSLHLVQCLQSSFFDVYYLKKILFLIFAVSLVLYYSQCLQSLFSTHGLPSLRLLQSSVFVFFIVISLCLLHSP